jgi:hypothetical protein
MALEAEFATPSNAGVTTGAVSTIRTPSNKNRSTYVTIPELLSFDQEIQNLLKNSCEHNLYYLPEFLRQAHIEGRPEDKIGAVMVRSSHQENSELIGLFLIEESRYGFLGPFNPLFLSRDNNAASTAPLLKKEFETQAVKRFLDWLEQSNFRNRVMCIEELKIEGKAWQFLKAELIARNREIKVLSTYQRPAVDTNSAPDAQSYEQSIKGKTRQNLKRKFRKLEELGELTFSVHVNDQRPSIVEEFLQLEMQGWKGEAGTALLSHAKSANFARKFLGNAKYPEVRIEALRLDGRAIAMTMHIVADGNAYHYKPTYDENYSRYSPGILLHRWTMQQMYETKWAHHMDSATAPDSQLGSIWKDRVKIGKVMFAASFATSSVKLAVYAAVDNSLQNIKPTVKKFTQRFRR